MNKKKKRKRKSNWTPPRNYTDFFSPEADQEFKRKHPIGYPALVMLGMVALLLPACLFCVLVDGTKSGWIVLGFVGGFVFGIGLFNFVAIIIKQYLGHLVSIACFLVGVDKLALVPITPRTVHGVSLPPAGRLNKAENGI